MNNYINTFNRIASTQKSFLPDLNFIPWLPIDETVNIDLERVLNMIRITLKQYYDSPKELIGECFKVADIVSNILLDNQIRHSVTIGEVLINRQQYFKISNEDILNELENGYQQNEPAKGHAWITLENGIIIDCTILSSLSHKLKKKPLKWIKSIYISQDVHTTDIEHIPYYLGPEYIFQVVMEPSEYSFFYVSNWMYKIENVNTIGLTSPEIGVRR